MVKYRCTVCGYIYDPEKGDPDSGIEPGTPFEKLPDDWVCPECGAPKDMFELPKYRCTVCGYIYDPEKGDPDSGVEPGTPFEKLPDDWVCPECGAPKDMFEMAEETTTNR